MPEEQNRILTDHLSEWLFCPTEVSIRNLNNEGITQNTHLVGDIMLDTSLFYRQILKDDEAKKISQHRNIKGLSSDLIHSNFALATVHRAGNTNDSTKLSSIVNAFNKLKTNIILPLHPRTRKYIDASGLSLNSNVFVIDPIGYLEMLELEMNCNCILIDSGGVQKEAYFMQKPCITLREQTEWVETVESGWNILVGSDQEKIIKAYSRLNSEKNEIPLLFGNGNAGSKILSILSDYF